MTEQDRIVLKLVAGFLDYPGSPQFRERFASRYPSAAHSCPDLARALEALNGLGWQRLAEIYVEAFDWSERGTLYLTAHELGDARERGEALAALNQTLSQAGYEAADGELPDYIPLLLEFLAVSPVSATSDLAPRTAQALGQVAQALGLNHPYYPLLDLARRALGEANQPVGEGRREAPDLENLPYPTAYP
ncbi:MAG: nitrate reductase molybdenum cofactor assembly chaperone [Thermaerobacter sp.]|nr:nitrate reductase molybdenum cofactor assembly chaperone [Thermaerobacter sp.]